MINDECDVIHCRNKAVYEIEEDNGDIFSVCKFHSIGKHIIKQDEEEQK